MTFRTCTELAIKNGITTNILTRIISTKQVHACKYKTYKGHTIGNYSAREQEIIMNYYRQCLNYQKGGYK